jgi:hypothetical protein
MLDMVFEWFFKSKKGKGFVHLQQLLKDLEIIDTYIDQALAESDVSQQPAKQRVIENRLEQLKDLFEEYMKLLGEQRATLELYVKTTVNEHDYLADIKPINEALKDEFDKLTQEFYTKDYLTFLDKTQTIRKIILDQIRKLEGEMKKFEKAAKQSLEFLYTAGTHNVDVTEFKSRVRKLGGIIDESMGKGGHFGVIFSIFTNTIGESKHEAGAIAGGTLAAFLRQREERIEPLLDPKYLECYFFTTDKEYVKIFVEKYKPSFEKV